MSDRQIISQDPIPQTAIDAGIRRGRSERSKAIRQAGSALFRAIAGIFRQVRQTVAPQPTPAGGKMA